MTDQADTPDPIGALPLAALLNRCQAAAESDAPSVALPTTDFAHLARYIAGRAEAVVALRAENERLSDDLAKARAAISRPRRARFRWIGLAALSQSEPTKERSE